MIIPALGNIDGLDRCLASLTDAKREDAQLEVIIVAAGSPHAGEIATKYNAKLVSDPDSDNFFTALNQGIEASAGDLVASIHPCSVVDANWVPAILNAAKDSKVGCFAGEIRLLATGSSLQRFRKAMGSLGQRSAISGWGHKPYARSANMAYRREVFDQIGLFDPDISACADAEFAWRMQDHTEYRLMFVPDAIVHHSHEEDFAAFWRSYAQVGADEASLSSSQSDYQPPLPSQLEEKLAADVQNIFDASDVAEDDEAERLHPILKVAARVAFLSGYLQKTAQILSRGETDEHPGRALSIAAPRCSVCGQGFSPPRGAGMAEVLRCGACGALPVDRILARALSTLDKRLVKGDVAMIGDPFPDRLAAKFHRLETRREKDRPGPASLDLVIVRDFGGMVRSCNMADALTALTSNLRPDGALILFMDMRESSRDAADAAAPSPISGAELDAQVSRRLPNAAVRTAWATDATTLERRLAIVAAATPEGAAATALSLSAT